MNRPDDTEGIVIGPEDRATVRAVGLSRGLALALIICLIGLFVAGFLPVAWPTPEQAQAAGLNQTVPTRTPQPIFSHKLYLPIVARAR